MIIEEPSASGRQPVQAIILAGGKGTRLAAVHPALPKALVPVAGKPFILWQLKWLAANGMKSVHLATGHLSEAIEKWVAHNPIASVSISISREPCPLGTAGAVKSTEPFISGTPFFIINGDSLLPSLDFQAMLKAHQAANAALTLAVTMMQSTGRFGTVQFDQSCRITSFVEKNDKNSGWINGGVYLADNRVFGRIASGKNISMETDVFPAMAKEGALHAFPCPPPLLDMGTPEGIKTMATFLSQQSNLPG